jgi:DNA-binding PadR family transcriptional regulator
MVLDLAILGVLKDSDLHGYELKKRLTELLGPFSTVSFGSLYPALARLEAAGAVKGVEANDVAPPAAPMTGSLGAELATFRSLRGSVRPRGGRNGRARKVYGITNRGHELFAELLAGDDVSTDDDRVFALRLAFARYLPPDARLGMLERRRAALVERLATDRSRMRAGRGRFDDYMRSLVEHGTEATERDISWLDRLIAAEHAGSAAHPTDHAAERQEEQDQ